MENANVAFAGSGHKLAISTYDFLCAISIELRVSSEVVNSVARIAAALFPDQVTYVARDFIPNLWMNRVMVQVANGDFMMVDADLWHNVLYYLKNFSGVNLSKYKYDPETKISFQDWFEELVRVDPVIYINTDKPFESIPQEFATKDYVDIVNRMSVAIYVMDVFGSAPREFNRSLNKP